MVKSESRVDTIDPGFLAEIREYAKREGLRNVTLIEGALASTNLPTSCCDAILMRNVYHHLTEPETFIRSVITSLNAAANLRSSISPLVQDPHYQKVCARIGKGRPWVRAHSVNRNWASRT